jgi:nucleoside 2-deoxyribosyltransferase
MLIAVVAGVASQQSANDPGTSFEHGRYTALLDPALDMYAGYFHPDRDQTWTPWP